MIDKLHNMANAILGISDVRYYDNLYRYIVINNSQYKIVIKDINENIILPIKESRNDSIEFRLDIGTYYLRCYDSDNKETFYDEIFVTDTMLNMSRTIII